MERSTLLIIVAVGTVAWLLYKRYVKKDGWRERYSPPLPTVENWYTDAMAIIQALDETTRAQREGEWEAMNETEQAEYAEKFMFNEFGQEALNSYTRKQRIKIGMARYVKDPSALGDPETEPAEGDEENPDD
jgi:hypothetical protein